MAIGWIRALNFLKPLFISSQTLCLFGCPMSRQHYSTVMFCYRGRTRTGTVCINWVEHKMMSSGKCVDTNIASITTKWLIWAEDNTELIGRAHISDINICTHNLWIITSASLPKVYQWSNFSTSRYMGRWQYWRSCSKVWSTRDGQWTSGKAEKQGQNLRNSSNGAFVLMLGHFYRMP